MEIKKVGVVGAGTMGNGIAHVFAMGGFDVVLMDVE
jgi:3-hydroxybutyryl-CoA dehydrogenase